MTSFTFYMERLFACPSYGFREGHKILCMVTRCASWDSTLTLDEFNSIINLAERDLQFFTAKHLEDTAQWADDALNLLKEQKQIVRCKDCKRKQRIEGTENIIYCPHVRMRVPVDWFCADGKRAE